MKKAACLVIFLLMAALPAIAAEDFRKRVTAEEDVYAEDDIQAELRFGQEVAARILGRYRLYEDERLARYVNLVGKSLSAYAGRPEIEFRIGILDADYVNAYAVPGGYIFVTKAAVDMASDESELAAVLAHEIAHISRKHIVKELNIKASDDSPVSGVARLLGASGDPAKVAFLKTVDKAMDMLVENGYKIEDELDADKNGVLLLGLAGYDPKALSSYLEKILKDEKRDASKSHPASKSRIEAINSTIEKEGLEGTASLKGKERFDAHRKK